MAIGIRGFAGIFGVAALMVIGAACGTGGPQATDAPATQQQPSGPVSTGMMLPRPNSVEELVARADIVFIGTILSVLGEKIMGPYGEDGQPLPAGEDGLPFTDYEARIAGLLKGDGQVQQDDALVLRMFGHLSNSSAIISPDVFTLPNPDDRLLFALGRNPDGTYGSGPGGLLNLEGEYVSYADGVPFGVEVSREQFLKEMAAATGPQAPTSEVRGPFDTASAEVTVLSVEDDMATMKILELRDYYRYPNATYPELSIGDEILVRVYDTGALRRTRRANFVALGIQVKEGEAPPLEVPQPVLIEGEHYRAEMSVCFSDLGLGCPFEGWSAAIYPLEQSPRSIAPPEESNTTPPPPPITPLGGARLTAPVGGNDESAAAATDVELSANQTGLPVESVEHAIAFQQAFGKYVDELIVRFPDQISAVWLEPVPNTRGHVQFTGEVPPEAISEIERQSLLGPNNVVITGEGMISMADHARRAELAAEALVDLGYRNFITFFDPIDKVISIELQLPEEAPQPSNLDLVGAVQDRVRAERDQSGEPRFQGRAAIVDALDLELTVITGSGPIVTLEHSRGGA